MFIHIANPKESTWFDFIGKYIDNYKMIYPSGETISFIRENHPSKVFIQSAIRFDEEFVQAIKDSGAKLIGHHNTEVTPDLLHTFKLYDLMLVGMDSTKEELLEKGINAVKILNAFDPGMDTESDYLPKINNVLCAGSLILKDRFHYRRMECINEMINNDIPLTLRMRLESNTPVDFAKRILTNQVVYRKYPRKLRKMNMQPVKNFTYRKEIKHHLVVFNCHIDLATEATNMRMFEVCGMGSLLLTDYQDNIHTIFARDEILTYNSIDELISKARWALSNPHSANKIAEAGYKRIMKEHLVEHRIKYFTDL